MQGRTTKNMRWKNDELFITVSLSVATSMKVILKNNTTTTNNSTFKKKSQVKIVVQEGKVRKNTVRWKIMNFLYLWASVCYTCETRFKQQHKNKQQQLLHKEITCYLKTKQIGIQRRGTQK